MPRVPAALAAALLALPAFAQAPTTYREAYNAGAKAINAGNLAAARAPLEAAFQLAKTDREKLEAQRALLIPYRELPDIGPMQGAAEYILTNSDQAAERSLTRRALLAFVHKRGQMPAAVAAYEERLKKTPEDATVLFILTEAYAEYQKDPARSAALAERLAAAEKKAGKAQDVGGQAQLAAQYVKAGKIAEGAELYEKIAPLDPKLEAWHYKEAAAAWVRAGKKDKALAAAKLSAKAAPEKRSDLLTYFWHRGLADAFLAAGDPAAAVPEYEAAIASAKIDGYLKDSQKKLAEAKAASGK